jgi:hypothetical protein
VSVDRRHVLGLLGGGLVAGVVGTPALADTALDVQILQTASSLEVLAEAAYARVALAGFGEAAARRHAEQKRMFQAQTTALGGRVQDAPNPKFQPLLAGDDPVAAATTIETVVVDTYMGNLSMLQDQRAKELIAAAMAVAAQHLAVLRAAAANPQHLRFPFRLADLAKLPATAVTVAIPDAFHQPAGPELIAEPASGAVG